jgi:S-adenosylmethionine:tRNA ribosyltransferase-isomerase
VTLDVPPALSVATAAADLPIASPAPGGDYALADFDFELPPELIAQHPLAERSASRLLDALGDPPVDRSFRDLPGLLRAGDLLVFNDTRVIKARLYGRKSSGGAVEALVERVLPAHDGRGSCPEVWAHLRASKSPRAGQQVHFAADGLPDLIAEVLGRCGPDDSLFHLRLPGDALALLERYGHVPLPPYITHADSADDERRYQTVFARAPGAVAAPTAALHFDAGVLAALAERGIATASVTLHVGAGTFQPVRVQRIAEHQMHSEWFELPQATADAIAAARARGGRVVAVGTTTLRALESAALAAAQAAAAAQIDTCASGDSPLVAVGARDTRIFITPGFDFRVVDLLVTNFHLPKSSLLMLVSAFIGHARMRSLYAHAIARGYRFFSYGDAMLLQRETGLLQRSTGAAPARQ